MRRRRHGSGWPVPPVRSGQVAVFLLIALTALVFVLLFIVDLHSIVQRKNQAQNAGDAAALAAARWQGATLNLMGELNLLHVLALANGQPAAVDAITNMQARLCFTGPMTALFAAQIAANSAVSQRRESRGSPSRRRRRIPSPVGVPACLRSGCPSTIRSSAAQDFVGMSSSTEMAWSRRSTSTAFGREVRSASR